MHGWIAVSPQRSFIWLQRLSWCMGALWKAGRHRIGLLVQGLRLGAVRSASKREAERVPATVRHRAGRPRALVKRSRRALIARGCACVAWQGPPAQPGQRLRRPAPGRPGGRLPP
jgi:hypothetical protein